MSDDIVARLRQWSEGGSVYYESVVDMREAADEIERLRRGGCARDQRTTQFCAEAVELQKLIEGLRSQRDEARHGESVAIATLQGVIEERTILRAERDQARSEICLLRASSTNATEKVSNEMTAHAISRGWHDLFADVGKHERTT